MKRETKYYEWKKPGSSKHDDRIPIYHDSPENRYITPWRERVFPSHSDLTEIDIERYVSLIRNWGYRLYKELEKVPGKECPGWDVDANEDGQSIIPCEHEECKTTNKKWRVHEIEDQEDLWY